MLSAAAQSRLHDEQRDRVVEAIDLLLDAGAGAGAVRREVTGEDLLALVSFLWLLELDDERVAHLLDLVTTGLQPDAARPDASGSA